MWLQQRFVANPTNLSSHINPDSVGMIPDSPVSEHAEFVSDTYWHLAGVIARFGVLRELFLRW